jgi:hypothetical protein
MISMHMKSVQIRDSTCFVCEFENTVVLDSEWETNIEIK